jgi:hypothetical protein
MQNLELVYNQIFNQKHYKISQFDSNTEIIKILEKSFINA